MNRSIVLLKSGVSRQGGLEKWARTLSNAYLQKGYHVTLLTTGQPANLSADIEVHSLTRKYPMSVLNVRAFDSFCMDFILKSKADLVLGLDRNSFQTHLRAGNGVHLAYLQRRSREEGLLASWKHTLNPLHRTLLALEKRAFEHPGLIRLITNSEMVRREVLDHYAVDPAKVTALHNGVEWESFGPSFDQWPENKSKEFELLFIGSGFRRKGLEPLLRGMNRLGKNAPHLSVVGKDKELTYFQGMAKKFGLSVAFHGEQRDVRPFYQRADALVIPSYYDPFANVTVEALAFGLYVVSSKDNGGSEVLTTETGTVLENLSEECVAAGLIKALQHPKTSQSAERIRASVRHLDFSAQLARFMELC